MFMAVTGWRKGSFIYKQSAYKNLLRSYKAAGALSWLYTYFFSHDFVMRGNFILFMQLVDSIRGTTQGTCLTVQMSNDKAKKMWDETWATQWLFLHLSSLCSILLGVLSS